MATDAAYRLFVGTSRADWLREAGRRAGKEKGYQPEQITARKIADARAI